MYIGLHIKCPLFMSYINGTWIFSTDFWKKIIRISNIVKIHTVGARFFHADGRTDKHNEANSSFPSYVNSPKNWVYTKILCAAFFPVPYVALGLSILPTFMRSSRSYLAKLSTCFTSQIPVTSSLLRASILHSTLFRRICRLVFLQ